MSAVIQLPWGVYASPIFRYRSALPIHIWAGIDNNFDGVSNDIATTAYRFKSVDDAGNPSFEEIGACTNVNCGRGTKLSTFNLRVSKVFALPGGVRVEAIAEGFNLFNDISPAFAVGAASAGAVQVRNSQGVLVPNTGFMKPAAYAGDTGQPEQRIGQLGVRVTF